MKKQHKTNNNVHNIIGSCVVIYYIENIHETNSSNKLCNRNGKSEQTYNYIVEEHLDEENLSTNC